ncbi:MAG: hypothetical protein GY906_01720 [bacterium]|nr:hypothetical protein [bacterium]
MKTTRMSSAYVAIVGLALLLNLGCQPAGTESETASENFDIAGWTPTGEISSYDPNTLYEYINGAADSFLNYGFEGLEVQDYAKGNLVVTVGIYDMGNPLDAFGIYRTEAGDGASRLAIGGEAVLSLPYQALLVKERYYAKLETYEGEFDETSGEELLRAVAAGLPGIDGLPEIVQSLPLEGQVSGSIRYEKGGLFGLTEISNCVWAQYQSDGGEEYRAFRLVLDEGTEAEMDAAWTSLGEKWHLSEHAGYPILTREVPYSGVFGVMRTEHGIFGVADSADMEQVGTRFELLLP